MNTSRYEALTAELREMHAALEAAKAELDVREDLKQVKTKIDEQKSKLDEQRKTIDAHGKSISSGLLRRDPWHKRHGVLIPFFFSALAAVATWWVTNDRAMIRAEIEHENVHSKITTLENNVQSLSNQAVTQQLHVTRMETMLEILLRKENLAVPAPVQR